MTKGRQRLIGILAVMTLGLIAFKFRAAQTTRREDASLVTDSLVESSAVPTVAAPAPLRTPETSTQSNSRDRSWFAPHRAVTMPLVFQELDADLLHLNQDQINAIQTLRTKFIEQVGGTNQSPDDPAYLEKWQKAQPEIDALLWFQLGKDIYQQAQLQAHAAASFLARGE